MPNDVTQQFWAKVSVGSRSECWIWTGVKANGYGSFFMPRKSAGVIRSVRAHRFSWELACNHPVPDSLLVLHHCDNPPCVNPLHLFLGTSKDNAQDRDKKGRGKIPQNRGRNRQTCKRGHVPNIYVTPDGRRNCRTCRYEAVKRNRVK